MHVETVTIDRTFRVVKHQWKGRKWTEFGFNAGDRSVYSARIYGHPEIRDSMKVTLVLPKRDAWSNICGWFDHSNNSIQIEGNGADWGFLGAHLFGVCLALVFLIGARGQLTTDKVVAFSLMLTAYSLVALFFGVRLARKLQAHRALRNKFPHAKQNAT